MFLVLLLWWININVDFNSRYVILGIALPKSKLLFFLNKTKHDMICFCTNDKSVAKKDKTLSRSSTNWLQRHTFNGCRKCLFCFSSSWTSVLRVSAYADWKMWRGGAFHPTSTLPPSVSEIISCSAAELLATAGKHLVETSTSASSVTLRWDFLPQSLLTVSETLTF